MPDIILTDIMMPDTDGLQLCRTLREDEQTNHIPIIVITAKATEEDKIRGLKAGADAYLVKPFNAEELNVRVENMLKSRALLQEKYNKLFTSTNIPSSTEHNYSFSEKSDDFVERFNNTIDKLLPDNNCTVETIADKMCMSVSTFRRKTIAVTGMPPKKYILNIRLEKARQMLQDNPDLTVNYVAEHFGFYDISHFVRMFRQRYGQNPTEGR